MDLYQTRKDAAIGKNSFAESSQGDFEYIDKSKIFPVISNQKINKYLKDLMKAIGVRKQITFHSARHTFATTVTLSNGVPIETVSKILGHSKLSTTQIYARVLENKLSSDISKLDQIIGEKRKISSN